MTERDVLEVGRQCLLVTLQLALPILLFGLVAGVLVSIFQAVTQIQEFTLTFVPKLLAVILALVIFGPWMLSTLVNFVVNMFTRMPPISG
ncbi:MAG TPA: flagellar biosynthesis protein FliQ [Chthonomonadales bacterium]|nr:flagellar biosynthesis protein FliQ [Chthonomonadales bacterium]